MRWFLLMCFAWCLSAEDIPTPTLTPPPLDAEHAQFAAVLQAVVRTDGVDYVRLRSDHAALDAYRVQLARAAVPTDRDDKIAFYINAYNACVLALLVEHLPADQTTWRTWSIRKLGGWVTSVWKYYTFDVAGARVTLDQLEHKILRPLGEPRIHFAINCASRSCPALQATPFRKASLNAQLDAATRAFATNPNQLRLDGTKVVTNPILSWFADDFKASGGVGTFLSTYAPEAIATQLRAGATLTYFDYDWSLNLGTTP